jgi:phosphinothricin acetyltransferase
MKLTFITINPADFHIIKDIYDYYILNSTATFRTKPVGLEEIKKLYPVDNERFKTYLIKAEDEIAGFCSIGPYKLSEGYERTALIRVFLKPDKISTGIGTQAVHYLEKVARNHNIKVLLAFITAGNRASERLVEKLDYIRCAHFKRIGEKFNEILDLVVYQKEL